MGKPLRVLLVEDDPRDAQLVLRELKRGDFDVTYLRVDTPEAMSAALVEQVWDLVISDYSMPRFSALMALAVVKKHNVELPFIIVSGTVGEDIAVEALHAGAHDFVAKGKLARLLPAIERELRDAVLRTERVKMKEQLLVSERMASVGTLAAGVAHEINNPLASLVLNLQMVHEDIGKATAELRSHAAGEGDWSNGERSDEWIVNRLTALEAPLRDAQEAADRVRRIVRDLKIFSRGDDEKIGAVHVRPVLESSLRIASNEIRHRAHLVEEYGDIPATAGNEGQLGQVFLNLIVNAAHAMPEGNADRNELRVVTKQDAQGRVVVEIQDTGSGMPPAVLSRMFDPFFTTKPTGVGTGLGLAICHRIVTDLGGHMEVESRVSEGTTVRTILPIALDEASKVIVPAEAVANGQRARVLVIDDEVMLGKAVCRMLAPRHDVIALTNARDALLLLAQGERFDVILCDLMMPELTGMELHAELMLLDPDQAELVVFMTGGAFTNKAREFLDAVTNLRIEKPFNMAALMAIVERGRRKE
jgi:signal transduction histidine kinase